MTPPRYGSTSRPATRRPAILAGLSWSPLVALVLGAAVALAACGPGATGAASSQSAGSAPASPASGAGSSLAASSVPSGAGPSAGVAASSVPPTVVASLAAVRLPVATSRAVAFRWPGGLIVCGGLTDAGTTSTILLVRPGTGAVAAAGHLAEPVHDAGGALLGGVPMVIGGGSVVAGTTVQRIGPVGRTVLAGHLPAPRADLGAVVVGGRVVVVGGGTPSAPDPRVLATADGIHFTVVARLPVPVRYPAVAAMGQEIVVVGGTGRTGTESAIQVIDPATGTARVVGRLPHGLSDAAALVLGGWLFVAGGRASGRVQDATWRVDPRTGAVARAGTLPMPIADAAAAVVDGVGYLVGGESDVRLASVVAIRLR